MARNSIRNGTNGAGDNPGKAGKFGWYQQFTRDASRFSGRPGVFIVALATILVWAVSGPFFGFSDTWQLLINTFTTLVTFLMVFLIQSSQNRDTEAIQLKLDELIRATSGAQNALMDLEQMDDDELKRCHDRYEQLALRARAQMERVNPTQGRHRKGAA
jgi:low affinity Fe/Cu permease